MQFPADTVELSTPVIPRELYVDELAIIELLGGGLSAALEVNGVAVCNMFVNEPPINVPENPGAAKEQVPTMHTLPARGITNDASLIVEPIAKAPGVGKVAVVITMLLFGNGTGAGPLPVIIPAVVIAFFNARFSAGLDTPKSAVNAGTD